MNGGVIVLDTTDTLMAQNDKKNDISGVGIRQDSLWSSLFESMELFNTNFFNPSIVPTFRAHLHKVGYIGAENRPQFMK